MPAGRQGFFIVFEGGEGAGKSVQASLLVAKLRAQGHAVVVTREPGGTRIGEQIRAITHNPENVDLDARAEAYLMAASRAQHVAEIIAPALSDGRIVVCDRFVDSTIAYQGYGRGLGPDVIARLNELAVNGAKPDLTFFLNVPVEVGLARREGSVKKDRMDLQEKEFYTRVHEGYLTLAKTSPARYVVIDATASVEEIASDIWKIIEETVRVRNGKNS